MMVGCGKTQGLLLTVQCLYARAFISCIIRFLSGDLDFHQLSDTCNDACFTPATLYFPPPPWALSPPHLPRLLLGDLEDLRLEDKQVLEMLNINNPRRCAPSPKCVGG